MLIQFLIEGDLFYDLMVIVMFFVFSIIVLWFGLYFVHRNHVHKQRTIRHYHYPLISVLIPAYNEANNIGKTLMSVFSSHYPSSRYEVVVVDDGSKDDTSKIASRYGAKVIRFRRNKGKVSALNKGIEKCRGEIIITIDADTILKRNTLTRLARYFKDKDVGAVSGAYKVRDPKSILDRLQNLEYFGFMFSRKIQEALSSVLVVPGAIGAFRKSVVKKLGGFREEILVEDYDLTVRIHKLGYKVKFDKKALAWTEPPKTLRSLWKQRTRWCRGGIQILKKHSDLLFFKKGGLPLILTLDFMSVISQFLIFLLVVAGSIRNFIIYGFSLPIINLSLLLQIFFDSENVLLWIALITMLFGFINTCISIKVAEERKRNIFLFPLVFPYSIFLSFVWIKSFFQELIGWKRSW